jgi:serine phosphatase RsbU (regulator of sigma subunit)/lipopolysaccharide biosynthesis regulator YciM
MIDSLKTSLMGKHPDTLRVKIYDDLVWELYVRGNRDEALRYAVEGLELAKKINYERAVADLYHQLGNIYYSKSNYTKSLENYFSSLKIKEKLGLKKGLASGFGSIGNVYQAQGNYPKALHYQFMALKLSTEVDHKSGVAVALNNIGNVYGRMNSNDSAMKYFNAAVKVDEEIDDIYGMSQAFGNISNIYKAKNDYNKSLEYIQRALAIQEKIGDQRGMAGSYGNLGTIYLALGKYTEALDYLTRSVTLSRQSGFKEYIKENYADLSKTYEKLGQKDKALEFYKKYSDLKDTLLNDENNKHIAEMSAQYDSDRKDNEIKLLNKDKEKIEAIAAAESKRQNIIISAVTIGFVFVLVFAFFVFRSNREKQKINIEITRQKEIIEERNNEVHESITYAKRIQTAILPPVKLVKSYLPESFILFRPKDIVSGDFYWIDKIDDKILFAAVDCTGHGVPGAMVSVVGNNGLNRALKEFGLVSPKLILDKLNELVEETFSKSESEVKDGMDISLCCLNLSSRLLHWSGANNPLWIHRNGNLELIKGDKQPVGAFEYRKPFTEHSFQLNKGDLIYIFTDGFADQFGGENGKKYKYKQLQEILLSGSSKEMSEQHRILNSAFDTWKGDLDQVDDVCIIGVRV